jgi:hypothetical protein
VSRARVAVLAVAMVLAGALLLRQLAPGASARPAEARDGTASPPAPLQSLPPVPAPVRDIFEYVRGEDPESPPPVRLTQAATLPAPPSLAGVEPPPPIGPRLVGIVRQGGVLRAALSVDGEVVVARAGERAGPYTVEAIDLDDGVRLRDASGTTLILAPPD